MFWSLSFQLMPDETLIEDSTKRPVSGLKPTYSVFLTTKRIIFRFDGVGSSMAQSFMYHEITDVRPAKRLLINYLAVTAGAKQYYIHVPEPDYWTAKITAVKLSMGAASPVAPTRPQAAAPDRKKQELLGMLQTLHASKLLNAQEFDAKKSMLDRMSV